MWQNICLQSPPPIIIIRYFFKIKYGYLKIFSEEPHTNNGNEINVGRTNQLTFISCNGPPLEHDSLKKLLKAGLVSMYGPFFHKHFVHGRNMSKYFDSKSHS